VCEEDSRALNPLPGTTSELRFEKVPPSMNSTRERLALFEKYSLVSERLGYGKISLPPAELRGGGDFSCVAPDISTALVGIGANGSGEHSPQATLDVGSLVTQSQRAGLLMLDVIQ
jgi:glutamate carboxypeptidase